MADPGRQATLVMFWDHDTQWGADRSRSGNGPATWGHLDFTGTERLIQLYAAVGMTACFAVVGAAAQEGARPYHDPGQLRDLHAAGHEVASHSFRHEWLPGVGEQGLIDTIRQSKAALEQCIGAPVTTFVPPYNQPFDNPAGLSFSLSERREVRRGRIGLRRLAHALHAEGYRMVRVADRSLGRRVGEMVLRRRLDKPGRVERIGMISALRLNTEGGFGRDSVDMLERCIHNGGVAVVYGHPHSLHAGNSQDERWLVPFLELTARYRDAGKLRVALPRDLAGEA